MASYRFFLQVKKHEMKAASPNLHYKYVSREVTDLSMEETKSPFRKHTSKHLRISA